MNELSKLNSDLRRTREQLSIAVNDLIEWSIKWAEAKPRFKEAEAKATAEAIGTVQERTAQATLSSIKEYREYLKAEAMKDALKIKVESLRAELSALQTEAGTYKAERDLSYAPEARVGVAPTPF